MSSVVLCIAPPFMGDKIIADPWILTPGDVVRPMRCGTQSARIEPSAKNVITFKSFFDSFTLVKFGKQVDVKFGDERNFAIRVTRSTSIYTE